MSHPTDDHDEPDAGAETKLHVGNDAAKSPPKQDANTPDAAPAETANTTQTLHRNLQTRLKKFTLLRKIGSGGFGSVWLAQDGQLNRKVAIKTPHPIVGEEADVFYKRVLREGRAAAALQHPSIIAVYEVDELDGVPYIVCEYISGLSLAERLALKRMPVAEAIDLAIPIAQALAHAHGAGIIHRDVKPANILLDAAGVPHIGDFGIAKHESVEETISSQGAVIGTPAYMSPEQAQGYSQDADARSDIYSLGVVLFQMLTGERPFRGNRRMLVHQVINDEPPSLRKLENSIPRDLDTVCLKCLQKDPARRYQNCRELAAELKRVRDGEPIIARPISRAERFYRICMKHRAISALVVLLLASLIVGLFGVTWQWRRAEVFGTEQQIARQAADRLSAELADQVHHSRRLIYNSRIALASEAWASGDYFRLKQHLQLAHQPHFERDRRDLEWYLLANNFRPIERIHQHGEYVTDVAISPDQELLAAAGLRTISVWNTGDGELRGSLRGHQSRIVSLSFSPDGRRLASLDEKGMVRVWNPYACQLAMPPLLHPGGGGTRLRFNPSGDVLATAGKSGVIVLWDPETGKRAANVQVSDKPISDFAWTNEPNRIVAGGQDATVSICDLHTNEVAARWKMRPPSWVVSVAAHPTKNLLAASLFNGDLVLLDPDEQQPIAEMESSGLKNSLVFMKTKPWISCVNLYGSVDFWDIENRARIKRHRTHGSFQVQATLAFDPDEERLVVGSNDGSVKLLKVQQLIKHHSYLVGHDGAINMLCFSEDGKKLIGVGRKGFANLYHPQTGQFLSQLYQHHSSLECVAISHDGARNFFGAQDGTIVVQDAGTGDIVGSVQAGSKVVRAIVDVPDADQFVSAGADGGIRLCGIGHGSSKVLYTHSGVVRSALLTRDTKTLITAGTDGVIRFASTKDWEVTKQIDDAGAGIFSMALSDSGKRLAVGLQSGQVRVLDIDQGKWETTLQIHAGPVQSVLFTRSENTIISGGNDKAVIISDLEIGEKKMQLDSHRKQVRCLALAPDETVLISCDNSGEANLWRAPRPAPSFERFERN